MHVGQGLGSGVDWIVEEGILEEDGELSSGRWRYFIFSTHLYSTQ